MNSDARRRVLLGADRMMADIDRITFVLPVGGPVVSLSNQCWADRLATIPLYGGKMLISCDWPAMSDVGLCEMHYAELVPVEMDNAA
jgi:hypothetical protein